MTMIFAIALFSAIVTFGVAMAISRTDVLVWEILKSIFLGEEP